MHQAIAVLVAGKSFGRGGRDLSASSVHTVGTTTSERRQGKGKGKVIPLQARCGPEAG